MLLYATNIEETRAAHPDAPCVVPTREWKPLDTTPAVLSRQIAADNS